MLALSQLDIATVYKVSVWCSIELLGLTKGGGVLIENIVEMYVNSEIHPTKIYSNLERCLDQMSQKTATMKHFKLDTCLYSL